MSTILVLKAALNSQKTFLKDLQASDEPDKLLVEKYTQAIADLKDSIIEMVTTPCVKEEVAPNLNVHPSLADYSRANLNAALIAKLPSFTGVDPEAVGSFITMVKQVKIATELSDTDLLPTIKGRLSPNPFRTLEQHEVNNGPVTTLEEFYDFLKTNWSLHLSIFQLLETCYTLKKQTDESWSVFNSRVMTNLTKVKIAHPEFCSKGGKKTPTADDVFSLLQTHMVLNNINANCPDMFRALTVEQTSLQSPAMLAQRAQTLQTQGLFQPLASVLYGSTPENNRYFSKGKNPPWYRNKKKKNPQDIKGEASEGGLSGKPKESGSALCDGRDNGDTEKSQPMALLASTHWKVPNFESSDDEFANNE
jgi:hypothetical protein